MRVITEERLQNTLFAEIQSVALANGTCHYGGYKTWCLSGEEVEQAIKNIFAQNDLFKPTVDIVLCKECKNGELVDDGFSMYLCHHHGSDWNEGDHFCSYGERKDNDI